MGAPWKPNPRPTRPETTKQKSFGDINRSFPNQKTVMKGKLRCNFTRKLVAVSRQLKTVINFLICRFLSHTVLISHCMQMPKEIGVKSGAIMKKFVLFFFKELWQGEKLSKTYIRIFCFSFIFVMRLEKWAKLPRHFSQNIQICIRTPTLENLFERALVDDSSYTCTIILYIL